MASIMILAGNAIAAGAGFGGAAFSLGAFGAITGMQVLSNALAPRPFVGSRLTDTSVQMSLEGTPIRVGYGRFMCSGNIIWSTGREEHIQRSDSGGGSLGPPAAEYATYTSNFAVLFSRIPAGARIEAIEKIWLNEHLVYDGTGGGEEGFEITYNATSKAFVGTQGDFSVRIYDGTQTTPDSLIEADKGVGKTPAYVRRVYAVCENMDLTPYGNDVPNVRILFRCDKGDAAEIAADIMQESGVPSGSIDVSALTETPFEGFLRDPVAPARQYLEYLCTACACDFPVVDGKLTAVLRAGTATETVTLKEQRVKSVQTTAATGNRRESKFTRAQDKETPERFQVHFYDPARNYLPGMRRHIRQDTLSDRKADITLPMIMGGNYAQLIANRECWRAVIESRMFEMSVGWKWLYLSVGDKLNVETRTGLTETFRVAEKNAPIWGPISLALVKHNAKLYEMELPEDTESTPHPTVPNPAEDFIYVMADSNALRLQDASDAGYYAGAVVPVVSGKYVKWSGANLRCADPGVLLDESGKAKGAATGDSVYMPFPAKIGEVDGILPDHAGGSSDWDTTTTLRVKLYASLGQSGLSSTTDSKVLNQGANAALVGSEDNGWEVIQFVNATYIGSEEDGRLLVYDLTRLKRGRRNTEALIATHEAGERFMLLDDAVVRVNVNPSAIGVEHEWQFTYAALNTVMATHDFTVSGNNLRPAAVKNLTGSLNSAGQWAFSWENVSRLSDLSAGVIGAPVDPVPPDLNEYEVEVLDQSDDSVVATYKIAMGNKTFAYRRSDQIEDFGSLQTSLKIRVYRMSSVVGRGYPAEVVVP